MKIAKLFLVLSLVTAFTGPLQAAPGLSAKVLAGLGAAAGSIFASGVAGIADTITNDKLADARKNILYLDQALKHEQNY